MLGRTIRGKTKLLYKYCFQSILDFEQESLQFLPKVSVRVAKLSSTFTKEILEEFFLEQKSFFSRFGWKIFVHPTETFQQCRRNCFRCGQIIIWEKCKKRFHFLNYSRSLSKTFLVWAKIFQQGWKTVFCVSRGTFWWSSFFFEKNIN